MHGGPHSQWVRGHPSHPHSTSGHAFLLGRRAARLRAEFSGVSCSTVPTLKWGNILKGGVLRANTQNDIHCMAIMEGKGINHNGKKHGQIETKQ